MSLAPGLGVWLRNLGFSSNQPRLLSQLGVGTNYGASSADGTQGGGNMVGSFGFGLGGVVANCTMLGNGSAGADDERLALCGFSNESYAGGSMTTPLAAYASQYNLPLTLFLAILAGSCSVMTVLGNLLVLVSFVLDRQIRQPGNYFIASLAVTDFLIGLFSMPLYTMYLLLGFRWPLGTIACDLWLSLDYTVCLTSQYTVFFITLDRFCSVSYPARYRAWRTEKKLKIMVLLTWLLPAFIFYVSIIGWPYFVGERTVPLDMCYVQFMENPLFNTALVISYYWTTLVVITVLYIGIYRIALQMARKSQAKRRLAENVIQAAAAQSGGHKASFAARQSAAVGSAPSNNKQDGSKDSDTTGGGTTMVATEATSHVQSGAASTQRFFTHHSSSKRGGSAKYSQQSPRKSRPSETHPSDDTPSEGSDHPTPKRSTRQGTISAPMKAGGGAKSSSLLSRVTKRPTYTIQNSHARAQSGVKTSDTSMTLANECSETGQRRTSSSNYSGESPQSRAGTSATPSPGVAAAGTSTATPSSGPVARAQRRQSVGWFRLKIVATVFRRMRAGTKNSQQQAPSILVEQVPLVDRGTSCRPTPNSPLLSSTASPSLPLKKAFDPSDFGGIYLGPTAEKFLAAYQQKAKDEPPPKKEPNEELKLDKRLSVIEASIADEPITVASCDNADAAGDAPGRSSSLSSASTAKAPLELMNNASKPASLAPSRSTSQKSVSLGYTAADDALSSSTIITAKDTTNLIIDDYATLEERPGVPLPPADLDPATTLVRIEVEGRESSRRLSTASLSIGGDLDSMSTQSILSEVACSTSTTRSATPTPMGDDVAPLATPQSSTVVAPSSRGEKLNNSQNNRMSPSISRLTLSALSNLSSTAVDSERAEGAASAASATSTVTVTSDSTLTRPASSSISTQVSSTVIQRATEREKFNRAVRPPKLDIVIRAPPEALVGIRWADSESVLSFNSQDTVRILPEFMDDMSSHSGSVSTANSRDSEPSSPVWIRRNSGHKMSTLHAVHELPEYGVGSTAKNYCYQQSRYGEGSYGRFPGPPPPPPSLNQPFQFQPQQPSSRNKGRHHSAQQQQPQPVVSRPPLPPGVQQQQQQQQPSMAVSRQPPNAALFWNRRLKFGSRGSEALTSIFDQLQVSVIPAQADSENSTASSMNVSPTTMAYPVVPSNTANSIIALATSNSVANLIGNGPVVPPPATVQTTAASRSQSPQPHQTQPQSADNSADGNNESPHSIRSNASVKVVASEVAAAVVAPPKRKDSIAKPPSTLAVTTIETAEIVTMTTTTTTSVLKRGDSTPPTTTEETTEEMQQNNFAAPLLAAATQHVDLLFESCQLTASEEVREKRHNSIRQRLSSQPQISQPPLPMTPLGSTTAGTSNSNNNMATSPGGDRSSVPHYQQQQQQQQQQQKRGRARFFAEVRHLLTGRNSSASATSGAGGGDGTPTTSTPAVLFKQRRSMRKTENRATKALRTITFILGAFVLTWTPYHILAIIKGFCNECVDDGLYSISYWLCYVASPLNPFCYAFANQQFKKAFLRILRCDFRSY